jgi:hypothetical protein
MPSDVITEHGRDEKVDIVRAIVLEDASAAQCAHQVISSRLEMLSRLPESLLGLKRDSG